MGNLPVPIVEVLHDEQPLVGLFGVGHQVALGSPVQVLVLQQPCDKLPFGHLNLLGGGSNVGAILGGDKGIEILHLGLCCFHFAFQPHPLTAFLQHVRCDLVDDVRLVHQLIQEIVGHVAAGLANTGQHFFKDPVLKLLCGGELTVDDQPVQISLGNVGQALNTARSKGVAFRDTLAMPLQRGSGVGVAECNCRIIGTEEILVALPQNPHLSKFRAVKHFEAQVFVFAHFHPFFSRLFRWLDHLEMICFSGEKQKERLPTTENLRKFITALCMCI